MSYHGYVIFFEGWRVAAEVERGRTLVAANEVAALATGVANIVVVALALKIVTLTFAIHIFA